MNTVAFLFKQIPATIYFEISVIVIWARSKFYYFNEDNLSLFLHKYGLIKQTLRKQTDKEKIQIFKCCNELKSLYI